jgi:hypothetical protein
MNHISLIGGLIVLLAHLPLFKAIFKKEIHLNIATWLAWAVIDSMTLIVSLVAHADFPALVIAFTTCAWVVLILVLRAGKWEWTKLETIVMIIVFISLVIWFLSGPLLALVALVVGKYGAAGILTARDAYKKPERKQALAWCLFGLGGLLNMIGAVSSVGAWRILDNLYPTIGTIFNSLIGILHLKKTNK